MSRFGLPEKATTVPSPRSASRSRFAGSKAKSREFGSPLPDAAANPYTPRSPKPGNTLRGRTSSAGGRLPLPHDCASSSLLPPASAAASWVYYGSGPPGRRLSLEHCVGRALMPIEDGRVVASTQLQSGHRTQVHSRRPSSSRSRTSSTRWGSWRGRTTTDACSRWCPTSNPDSFPRRVSVMS